MNFLWILGLHFIADAGLQPDWILKRKYDNWFVLFEHSMIYATVVGLGFLFLSNFSWSTFFILLFSHYLIDLWKIKHSKDPLAKRYLYIDQLVHALVLIGLYV